MSNYPKMIDLKNRLIYFGHEVILPDPSNNAQLKEIISNDYVDTYQLKIKYDYIRKHYNNIVIGDCVLIANYAKKGIENYIGGNSFLEMGFAYTMDKPIYLVNPIPSIENYYHEMVAMKPILLNNNLELIKDSVSQNKNKKKQIKSFETVGVSTI